MANFSRLFDRSVVRTGLGVRQSDTSMRACRQGVDAPPVLTLHPLVTPTSVFTCMSFNFSDAFRLQVWPQ